MGDNCLQQDAPFSLCAQMMATESKLVLAGGGPTSLMVPRFYWGLFSHSLCVSGQSLPL